MQNTVALAFVLGFSVAILFVIVVNAVRNRRSKYDTVEISLEAAYQRRRAAADLLEKHGIIVHQYFMPTYKMLEDLGIEEDDELFWALNEFDGKCYIFTDRDGRQWGKIFPLSKEMEKAKLVKRHLRLVK